MKGGPGAVGKGCDCGFGTLLQDGLSDQEDGSSTAERVRVEMEDRLRPSTLHDEGTRWDCGGA